MEKATAESFGSALADDISHKAELCMGQFYLVAVAAVMLTVQHLS